MAHSIQNADHPARTIYVYILECVDKSLYTGWTNDLEKRLRTHNEGSAAKYTRSRRPVKLVYCKECATATAARKQEARIKKLTRHEKLLLIADELTLDQE